MYTDMTVEKRCHVVPDVYERLRASPSASVFHLSTAKLRKYGLQEPRHLALQNNDEAIQLLSLSRTG
jgi:hypothetical protein